jgi:hypothetical protein
LIEQIPTVNFRFNFGQTPPLILKDAEDEVDMLLYRVCYLSH